jgi:hypothetical protein
MTVTYKGTGQLAIAHGCIGTSTSPFAVLDGSEVDMRGWTSLAYTLYVYTHDVSWAVFGAAASTFAGEVTVMASTSICASITGSGTYSAAYAPYDYYRVKIEDFVSTSAADVSLYALARS